MRGIDWKGMFTGLFQAAQEEGAQIGERQLAPGEMLASAPLPPGSTAREEGAPSAELTQLRQQLATMQQHERATKAAAFADAAVRERRAMPAEHAELVALYTQALADDTAAPVVSGQATRAQRLEGLIKARPQHSLTQERVPQGSGGTLPASDGDDLAEVEASARAYAQRANGKK